MKLLQLIKNLFAKKEKEMIPKESYTVKGLPDSLELSKKNLIVFDVFDAAIYADDNIVACGEVAINQINKGTDDKVSMKIMHVTAPIPKDSELRLELSGMMYDPNTQKIEYNFYPSIEDVERLDDDKVSFKVDNITTLVVSTEMVERVI